MNPRSIALGIPLAAALTLAACGGGTSPAPATSGPGAGGSQPAATTRAPAGSAPAETEAPSAPPAASGPVDACALLTADEVATLVPQATATPSASEDGPIPSYTCTWDAAISKGTIPVSLKVTVSPSFVSGSGQTLDFITAMIKAEGTDPDNGGRVVDGLGDAASVTSMVKFDAEVQFVEGDMLVQVDYTGDDAPSKQDAVIELAYAVSGRLP
jgi:hypothetical protein